MTIFAASFSSHLCLTGLRWGGGNVKQGMSHLNGMIILKLNISSINVNDLANVPQSLIPPLKWYERIHKGGLEEDTIALIEEVSDVQYEAFNGNSFQIKTINIDYDVPVYLDDKEEQKLSTTVEIKREELESYVRDLQNEIDRLTKNKDCEWPGLKKRKDDLDDSLRKNPDSDTIQIEINYTRLGHYIRKGGNHNPEIVLFMGAIGDDKQLLISTYVHEMFHAYYDLCWMKDQNNLKYKNKVDLTCIEEPLTEYAMLKFLEKFVQTNPEYAYLLDVAARNVKEKQLTPGTCHYGFGYYLWKWEKEANEPLCNWIKCYKEAKFEIRNSNDKRKFDSLFSKGFYPYGKEYDSMELLRKILTEDKSKQQNSNNVYAGGGIMNKGKKGHLRGWYL